MALGLFLLFIALPIVEIALFIKVGGAIGLLPTLAIVVGSGIAGVGIVRWQGLRSLERLRAAVETGGDPARPIAHAALLLVAGFLLILPGFLTDTLGLLLLLPPVRDLLIRWGASKATVRAATYVRRPGGGRTTFPEVIEADYEVVDDEPEGSPRRRSGPTSGWTQPH